LDEEGRGALNTKRPPFHFSRNDLKILNRRIKPVAEKKKPVDESTGFLMAWCPRRDSNPHTLRHMDLNHARLPIPPRGPCEDRDYSGKLPEVKQSMSIIARNLGGLGKYRTRPLHYAGIRRMLYTNNNLRNTL
jgi:hypothetical protein